MRTVILIAGLGVLLGGCDLLKQDKKDQGSTPASSAPGSAPASSPGSAPASTPASGPPPAPASAPTSAPPIPVSATHDPDHSDPSNTPPAAALRFYEDYATLKHTGLPGEADRLMLQAQLTPALDQLLEAAIVADARRPASKRFKGDPFSANPSAAASFTRPWCNWSNTGDCHPTLTNPAETWNDVVLVNDIDVHGQWRVGDIEFHGTKAGDRAGKLSDLLKQIAGN